MNRGREPRSPNATRTIAFAFAVSTTGSIGLAVTYLQGGQTQFEGLFLGLAFAGLAFGMVAWSKHLMPNGPYVEERDSFSSEEEQREKVAADFVRGGQEIGRRKFLGRAMAVTMGALGVAIVFPIRSLGPSPGRALFETSWENGARLVTLDDEPVRAEDVAVGSSLTVYPEGRPGDADAQAVLIRTRPGTLRAAPGREDWTVDGLVAYSRICTHAGCLVGLYDVRTDSLFCPCHQGTFNVSEGARPVSGPVTRALPQLPLRLDAQGYLRARGDFPEPVGVGFWNRGRG